MSARRRRRLRRTIVVSVVAVGAVVGIGAVALVTALSTRDAPAPQTQESASPSAAPSETPVSLTAAQQLLADSDDENACAVSFVGEGIENPPLLQATGQLFAGLPVPDRDGVVFAGWYSSAEAAAGYAVDERVNGAELVVCGDDRELRLHGAWKPRDEVEAAGIRIPILMYHQFTSNPEGEDNWLRLNYAYVGDFETHMEYIATGGFYLPTWDELAAFIDGRLFIPDRSVIVTDDDADQSWFDLAVPVVDRLGVLATSFMITADRQDPAPSPYVLRRSHTHDMHQAGDNGEGRMVNWSAADIAADLETSAQVLGVKEVVAYPFGHYNETTKEGVSAAAFEMGRTIEQGYVSIGTDKLALPVIRINYGMGLDALRGLIG